jgi:hypothetical protein
LFFFPKKNVLVITTPRDHLSDVSSAELIQNLFHIKYPNSYMIYTLDQSSNNQLSYRKELFHNRVRFLRFNFHLKDIFIFKGS